VCRSWQEKQMDKQSKPIHDRSLFDAVLLCLKALDGDAREANLFGYPAVFLGRRIVLCVYGRGIGIRLPPHYAADLIQSGRAFPFQPYGRSVMQEWVEIHVPPERVDEMVPVFIEAARFVREIDPDS